MWMCSNLSCQDPESSSKKTPCLVVLLFYTGTGSIISYTISTGRLKPSLAERLAYAEILKLWQQSFGAKREDFVTKNALLTRLSKIYHQYQNYLKTSATTRAKNIAHYSKRWQQTLAYFENVFSPLTGPPPTKIIPPFEEWEQKGLDFEAGLSFSVMKIPKFDEVLVGKESSSSWISANIMAPPEMLSANDNEVRSDYEVNAPTFDTLTWDREKNDTHADTGLKDQSTQTVMHCPPSFQTWPVNFFKIEDSIGDTMED